MQSTDFLILIKIGQRRDRFVDNYNFDRDIAKIEILVVYCKSNET